MVLESIEYRQTRIYFYIYVYRFTQARFYDFLPFECFANFFSISILSYSYVFTLLSKMDRKEFLNGFAFNEIKAIVITKWSVNVAFLTIIGWHEFYETLSSLVEISMVYDRNICLSTLSKHLSDAFTKNDWRMVPTSGHCDPNHFMLWEIAISRLRLKFSYDHSFGSFWALLNWRFFQKTQWF